MDTVSKEKRSKIKTAKEREKTFAFVLRHLVSWAEQKGEEDRIVKEK